MAELNKILLVGRLTKDPDLRYTASGMAVATLRMAVNHTYRTKEEKKEEVLYIDANVWGRSAEAAKKFLAKGREVLVEGRLQMNDWTDKQGQKRRDFRVNADNLQFIGGAPGGGRSTTTDTEGSESGPPPDTFDSGEPAPRNDSARSDSPRNDAPPAQAQEDDLPF